MYGGLYALSGGTIPDPLWPPLLRDWGFATQLLPLISGTGKATDFKFGGYIYGANPNKSPLKIFGENGAWACAGTAHFWGYPLLFLRTSNFEGTFIGWIGTKAPEKCWAQSGSHGHFQGTIQGALRGHLCDSTAFLSIIQKVMDSHRHTINFKPSTRSSIVNSNLDHILHCFRDSAA